MCIDTEEKQFRKKLKKELKERGQQKNIVKLLLLGTGESGKSTFMKQMRIIHDNGFTQKELIMQRVYVFHNTVICMKQLVKAMTMFGLKVDKESNQEYVDRLLALDLTYANVQDVFCQDHFPEDFVQCIQCLWNDPGVQKCFEMRNQFPLSDSAEYFFKNVQRFGIEGYIPTEADMVRIRVPTTGVNEYLLQLKKAKLSIVDVGGQDKERIKWINCFEGVKSIIFLTALNEYDMFRSKVNKFGMDEIELFFTDKDQENRVNRMQESLALFKVITSLELLSDSSFILFFNKTDLFNEKIARFPLKETFADYSGPVDDCEAASEFIKQMFLTQAYSLLNSGLNTAKKHSTLSVQSHTRRSNLRNQKHVYSHFTCATDTENIKFVFNSVKHTILMENIDDCGILMN